MKRQDQVRFVRELTRRVKATLIERSANWPAEWDGHELRELIAYAFDNERTDAGRAKRRRIGNEIAARNLY